MELTPFATSILTALFVSGAAWGATKTALNGTKQHVKDIHAELRQHIREEHNADMETHERIARVETKIDVLVDRFSANK